MNILIKLTCLVGLVIAPILGGHGMDEEIKGENVSEEMYMIDEDGNQTLLTDNQAEQVKEVSKEIMVSLSSNDTLTTADVTIKTTKDGETTTESKTFKGTEEEVNAQIEALRDQSQE